MGIQITGSPIAPAAHASTHRIGGSDPITAALVVDPASPYTVASGVREISVASSTIVVLPDSGVNVGEVIRVSNSSSSSITVTLRRAGSDNIDGAASDVAITTGAHAIVGAIRRASADWRSLQPASVNLTGAPRSVEITLVAGVAGWIEYVLIGGTWTAVSSHTALTTETDGGVTFSGTTMTLPLGIAASTTSHGCADERYMAFSSASAELQAMIAQGARWKMEVNVDTVENVDYGRVGFALTSAAGSFDAAGENLASTRIGWDSTVYRLHGAFTTGGFNSLTTSATLGPTYLGGQIGTANTGAIWWPVASYDSNFSTGTGLPTRLYLTGSAITSATAATIAVGNPRCRVTFYPAAL